MKRFLSLSILVAVLTIYSHAVQAQGKRSIGIRAGYQNSGLFKDSEKLTGTSNYASFYVGVFKEKKILPFLHWGTGLEYCQNGAGLTGDSKQVIKYLGIPVHLKVKVGPVYALVGVQPKVKLSEKIILDGDKTSPTDEQKSKTMDFPAYGGIGFNILIVSIEARYQYSMFETNHGARNAYLQLGATLHL
ncbi:MAG: outer membrane beta-barrel protein [Bacteroidales bacterium]